MYNMDISIFGYKLNLEILILMGVVYLILVGHTVCGCCNMGKIMEGLTDMATSDMDASGNKTELAKAVMAKKVMATQDVAGGSTGTSDNTTNVSTALANGRREGFTGANINYGESSMYNLNDDQPVDTSSWSAQNMTVTPGQPLSAGVKQFLARKPQQLPLAEGEMNFFANSQFKPECCPSTYSTSTAKLQCAASLCSWSRSPANASRLANEGAVRAINILALEPIKKIGLYCAAAYRYMSEHLELAIAMIEETKTISTISEMINNNSSNTDDFIAYNLAIALVNLTRVNGKEGVVVDAAIVLALMNLTMMKPELNATCVRGLYNLTCVDTTYT